MSEEPVDVLIVGAGASGAALAWSLAETRMRILCLEQGDWMDPAQYPSNASDWDRDSIDCNRNCSSTMGTNWTTRSSASWTACVSHEPVAISQRVS